MSCCYYSYVLCGQKFDKLNFGFVVLFNVAILEFIHKELLVRLALLNIAK